MFPFPRARAALVASFLATLPAAAQETKVIPVSRQTVLPESVAEVRFTDNSSLRLTLLDGQLDFKTAFGKLTVPVASVRRIDFASRVPEEVSRRIEAAIAGLSNPQFRSREAASAELLAVGERAYPAVLRASRGRDTEAASRAEEIARKMRESIPEERLRGRDQDVLHADDCRLTGHIDTATLKAHCAQFGQVTVRLADLQSLRMLSAGAEAALTLDGNRYAVPQEAWLDTRIDLQEGSPLQIAAEGEMDMYPMGADVNVYIASPKGKKRWGRDPGRAQPHEAGVLLGKIGSSGKEFVIGERFDANAPASGRLYLRAARSPWDVIPSGSYTVKVSGGTAAP